jgi:hypothetical protein
MMLLIMSKQRHDPSLRNRLKTVIDCWQNLFMWNNIPSFVKLSVNYLKRSLHQSKTQTATPAANATTLS